MMAKALCKGADADDAANWLLRKRTMEKKRLAAAVLVRHLDRDHFRQFGLLPSPRTLECENAMLHSARQVLLSPTLHGSKGAASHQLSREHRRCLGKLDSPRRAASTTFTAATASRTTAAWQTTAVFSPNYRKSGDAASNGNILSVLPPLPPLIQSVRKDALTSPTREDGRRWRNA
jgi:hypothetical protein